MSETGISEDDWRAEIDRVAAEEAQATPIWSDDERKIVCFGRGKKITLRALLIVINKENQKADRRPRTLMALEHFIRRLPKEQDDVGQT